MTNATQTVALNTGHRIVECEIFTAKNGRTYALPLRDIGAAFHGMPAARLVWIGRKSMYDLGKNGFGLTTRGGEFAMTALDENGQKREGYRG